MLLGDVKSGKKLHTIPGGRKGTEDRHVGHTAHILCMAISSDGKYLVSTPLPLWSAHDFYNYVRIAKVHLHLLTEASHHLFRPLETWTNWLWYGRQKHVNISINSQATKALCRYVLPHSLSAAWNNLLWGPPVTHIKCLFLPRVFHSGRELMIFTAPLMIAQ